ncbi:hypothetical protein BKE30_11690 [Alkanindiges hydrocarboniclasticus]|uniref:Uncharacterized protein n=1 Tax=Alkanindiges hydrocarboniclasticus TaxID=1907941 RepID=A0A1S8CTE0_9GAMM|nr:hypothetical protein [Alkanindiges hydrocarboniclasticus]ONG38670.1 hypothetical protein BKE30_11690 [Alkanindiges hydrocarboniclasticus]
MPNLFAFLDTIPEYYLAIAVYLGGSLFVLWLWYFIARALPRPIGGMSWILLFALLLSPTITEGTNAKIAPAIVGLMFGFLTDEKHLIWSNLVPILFVAALGFFLGYLWNKYQEYREPTTE